MKLNYITLSILILILLISCSVIIFQNKNKIMKNDILQYNNKLFTLVNSKSVENFEGQGLLNQQLLNKYNKEDIKNKLLITDIKVDKSKVPHEILVLGKNLDKIKKVMFDSIEGNIKNPGNITELQILPPNLLDSKYQPLLKNDDIISLEIKLFVEDNEEKKTIITDDKRSLIRTSKEANFLIDYSDLGISILDIKKGYLKRLKISLDIDYYIKKIEAIHRPEDTITSETIKEDEATGKLNEIRKTYLYNCEDLSPSPSPTPSPSISCTSKADLPSITILINGVPYDVRNGRNELIFTLDKSNYLNNSEGKKNLISIYINEYYSELFLNETYGEINIQPGLTIEKMDDTTSFLLPTGLFFKPGLKLISTGIDGLGKDPNDWSLVLKDRKEESVSEDLRSFYDDTLNLIADEPPAPTESEDLSYEPVDFSIQLNEDIREVEVIWKPPTALLEEADLTKFFYYFTFEPVSGKANDNFKQSVKIPILKDTPLDQTQSIKKEYSKKHSFSYDRLLPMHKYKYSFIVATDTPIRKSLDSIDDVFEFVTADMKNNYHTHLFDAETGKFKLDKLDLDEIKSKNPELVQTYYQMVAYNQRKAEDDIRIAQLDMADSTKCLQGHTDQFMYGHMGSAFKSNLSKYLNDNTLKEGKEFKSNQILQDKQIERIEKKVEEIEEHQGKKVSLHDLKINTLKSLHDGSLIRLEELNGEKRLVLLNDGCLAFQKNPQYGKRDDYGYLPCNLFDVEQHFTLNKINNLDEYNFLLSSNLKPTILEEDNNKFDYPFYTLQPKDSSKCVTIENNNIQIKPCTSDKNIRFTGYFNKDECNV